MLPNPSLFRVGLAAGWSFLVISVAWLWLGPYYDMLLESEANVFLGSDLLVYHQHALFFRDANIPGFHTSTLHVGPAVVLALAAATPSRSWKWRGIAGACVLVAFLLLHGVTMAGMALPINASIDPHVIFTAFAVFWGLTPLVIGGAWVYRLWLPALRASPSEQLGHQ